MDEQTQQNFLEKLLANEHILYMKVRNFHWNIVGQHFVMLHEKYETLYQEIANVIDMVAERMRMQGFVAPANFAQFLKIGQIQEQQSALTQGLESAQILADDLQTLNVSLQSALKKIEFDPACEDMLIEILRGHQMQQWQLRSLVHKD